MHDIREHILVEAKKRFSRAGIQNAQYHHDISSLKEFYNKMDWIVLDVPCSGYYDSCIWFYSFNEGTGTLRRNPDIKLKFSLEKLKHNVKFG